MNARDYIYIPTARRLITEVVRELMDDVAKASRLTPRERVASLRSLTRAKQLILKQLRVAK